MSFLVEFLVYNNYGKNKKFAKSLEVSKMKKENVNKNIKTILADLLICLISGIIVGFAYYLFSTPNDFAPGGVSGIASILVRTFLP